MSIVFITPQLGLPRGSFYTPKQSVVCPGVSGAQVPQGDGPPGSLSPRSFLGTRARFLSQNAQMNKIFGALNCQKIFGALNCNCFWRSQLSKNCLCRSELSQMLSPKVKKSKSQKVPKSQSQQVKKSKRPKVPKFQSPKVKK